MRDLVEDTSVFFKTKDMVDKEFPDGPLLLVYPIFSRPP
uniref:Uncharacterized protein n=1 Tax=Vitis vinifera TaxID=29760 RepID=F6HA79_VITVI